MKTFCLLALGGVLAFLVAAPEIMLSFGGMAEASLPSRPPGASLGLEEEDGGLIAISVEVNTRLILTKKKRSLAAKQNFELQGGKFLSSYIMALM